MQLTAMLEQLKGLVQFNKVLKAFNLLQAHLVHPVERVLRVFLDRVCTYYMVGGHGCHILRTLSALKT